MPGAPPQAPAPPQPQQPFLRKDFIVVGEFCEIQGPVVVTWSSPKDWLTQYIACLNSAANQRTQTADAFASLDRKPGESYHPNRDKWTELQGSLEAAVRRVCNAIVMRTLTGDIVHSPSQMSSSAIVCIDAVPWLGNPIFGPKHEAIQEYTDCGTAIATTSSVISIPDSTARGFSRTLCIIYASMHPLVGEQAALVTGQLRAWSTALASAAESNHVKELQSFHARLSAVTSRFPDADSSIDPAVLAALPDRDRHAIEHFLTLPDHSKRRFFEEQSAVERRLKQLRQPVGNGEQMTSTEMTVRLLSKGSQPLRPLASIAPFLQYDSLRLPETSSDAMKEWMSSAALQLAYASLCNLRCCIVAEPGADQSLVDHLETMCQAIFGEYGMLSEVPAVPKVNKLSMGCFEKSRVVRCDTIELSNGSWRLPVVAAIMSSRGVDVRFPVGWLPGAPDDNWVPPPESCIASSLRLIEDVDEVFAAMEELRQYIRGRAVLRILSTDDARAAFESVGSLAHGSRTAVDTGGTVESTWLLNCLRCQAAVHLNGANVVCKPIIATGPAHAP